MGHSCSKNQLANEKFINGNRDSQAKKNREKRVRRRKKQGSLKNSDDELFGTLRNSSLTYCEVIIKPTGENEEYNVITRLNDVSMTSFQSEDNRVLDYSRENIKYKTITYTASDENKWTSRNSKNSISPCSSLNYFENLPTKESFRSDEKPHQDGVCNVQNETEEKTILVNNNGNFSKSIISAKDVQLKSQGKYELKVVAASDDFLKFDVKKSNSAVKIVNKSSSFSDSKQMQIYTIPSGILRLGVKENGSFKSSVGTATPGSFRRQANMLNAFNGLLFSFTDTEQKNVQDNSVKGFQNRFKKHQDTFHVTGSSTDYRTISTLDLNRVLNDKRTNDRGKCLVSDVKTIQNNSIESGFRKMCKLNSSEHDEVVSLDFLMLRSKPPSKTEFPKQNECKLKIITYNDTIQDLSETPPRRFSDFDDLFLLDNVSNEILHRASRASQTSEQHLQRHLDIPSNNTVGFILPDKTNNVLNTNFSAIPECSIESYCEDYNFENNQTENIGNYTNVEWGSSTETLNIDADLNEPICNSDSYLEKLLRRIPGRTSLLPQMLDDRMSSDYMMSSTLKRIDNPSNKLVCVLELKYGIKLKTLEELFQKPKEMLRFLKNGRVQISADSVQPVQSRITYEKLVKSMVSGI